MGKDFGDSDDDSLDQMAVARFNDPALQEVRREEDYYYYY